MSTILQGTLFSGENLAGVAVRLTLDTDHLRSAPDGPTIDVPLRAVRTSDRLADVPRYLYLPDGRTVETPDNDTVDLWLSHQRRGRLVALVHALERHSQVAAAATILMVTSVAFTLWWALPRLALRAAMAVPTAVELQAGQAGLAGIEKALRPSELNYLDRTKVYLQLEVLLDAAGIKEEPKLYFFSMGGQSPNAFALPGGVIIMSDELVKLASSEDEIAAVLAHEIGHWQRRHGLQTVMRSSAALLVVSTVTGDLSTLTTFAGTIPFLLLQRGYSREFEAEADHDAIALLAKCGVGSRPFATILEKLEKARPAQGRDFTYLSTHPSTADRIRSLAPDKAEAGPTDGAKRPKRVRQLDVMPKPLRQANPRYPYNLRKAGTSGNVVVEFAIDEEGYVRDAHVVRSSHVDFEAPSLNAVSSWRFTPAERRGHKVPMIASQLLEFDADEPAAPPPH